MFSFLNISIIVRWCITIFISYFWSIFHFGIFIILLRALNLFIFHNLLIIIFTILRIYCLLHSLIDVLSKWIFIFTFLYALLSASWVCFFMLFNLRTFSICIFHFKVLNFFSFISVWLHKIEFHFVLLITIRIVREICI